MFRGILLALIASASWGLVYVLEQKVLVQFSVAKFMVFQALFMGVAALIILFFTSKESAFTSSDFKVLLHWPFLLLILGNFVAEFFILNSVQAIGAEWATLFEISYPLFTAVFAYYLLKQPIHWATLIGALLIISGSGIVIYFNKLL